MTTITLYRFYNGNGTSKDWGIHLDGNVVNVYYGSTDNKLRLNVKTFESDHEASNYRLKMKKQKIAKGYEHQGDYQIENNKVSIKVTEEKVEEKPKASKKCFWSITQPIKGTNEFFETAKEIVLKMKETLPELEIHCADRQIVINDFVLGTEERADGFLSVTNIRVTKGEGIIHESPEAFIIVVFFASLSKRYPNHFSFTDDNGSIIDLKYSTNVKLFAGCSEELAENMELVEIPLHKIHIQTDIQSVWF